MYIQPSNPYTRIGPGRVRHHPSLHQAAVAPAGAPEAPAVKRTKRKRSKNGSSAPAKRQRKVQDKPKKKRKAKAKPKKPTKRQRKDR